MTVHLTSAERPAPVIVSTGPRGPGRGADLLPAAAAALAVGAAGFGVLLDPYGAPASTAAMLRGYDLVTLPVAVTLMVLTVPARRGSESARMAQAAMLAYLVYTYAYYLFGTGFNDLFLLHVAVFTASLVGLALTVSRLDFDLVARYPVSPLRTRVSAGLLGLLAVALAAMWLYVSVANAVTGDVPAGSRLVESDTIVHLGIALDLAVLVPWYATAAWLLWRGRAGGYAAAVVALASGLLHQVSYLVALPMQVAADVPGAAGFDPGEPVIVLLYTIALGLLLTGQRHPDGAAGR